MRKFVLDTNIVLAYMRQSPLYLEAERRFNLTSDDAQLIISVVTIGEIRVLARRNGWGEKKIELLNSFIEQVLFVVDVSVGAPELLDAYVGDRLFFQWSHHGEKRPLDSSHSESNRIHAGHDRWRF